MYPHFSVEVIEDQFPPVRSMNNAAKELDDLDQDIVFEDPKPVTDEVDDA